MGGSLSSTPGLSRYCKGTAPHRQHPPASGGISRQERSPYIKAKEHDQIQPTPAPLLGRDQRIP